MGRAVVQGVAGTRPLTQSRLGYDTVTAPQLPMECHLVIIQGRGHGRDLGKSLGLKGSVSWSLK